MAVKTPRPDDVLRLGQENATIKANLSPKRWAKFVKLAHARGYTIAGQLSNQPDALKERTTESLRSEAQKTVATAYAPAEKALTQRQAAIGFLDEKRKTDDAAYRTWLIGETEKLNAQAKAADATLATTQSTIATETKTAIDAARADSLQRMTGGVSDPTQSAALDTSAADTAATNHVAAAREQSAAITKIGADSRTLAGASVLAQQGAREATRNADTWKALGELAADRTKLESDRGAATAERTDALIGRNTDIAKSNREADLAAASLNLKQDDLAAQIKEADQKYKVDKAKFGLEQWKAANKAKVDQAKIDLGYDQIKSREGIAAAKRALDKELTKLRNKEKKDKTSGVSQDERDVYADVGRAQALFVRWDQNNAVPLAEREQKLRDMGASEDVIAIAHDLARNHGMLSSSMRARARRAGIKHTGYFWPPPPTAADTPPGGNPGR